MVEKKEGGPYSNDLEKSLYKRSRLRSITSTIIGVMLICVVVYFVFIIVLSYNRLENICKDNHYEFRSTGINQGGGLAEPGYVQCCNNVYVDHLWNRTECKAFKR